MRKETGYANSVPARLGPPQLAETSMVCSAEDALTRRSKPQRKPEKKMEIFSSPSLVTTIGNLIKV